MEEIERSICYQRTGYKQYIKNQAIAKSRTYSGRTPDEQVCGGGCCLDAKLNSLRGALGSVRGFLPNIQTVSE